MFTQYFVLGPPEALEMALSQKGPDQNIEFSMLEEIKL